MGLEKAIEHGKEHRKPYRGWEAYDTWCRNHGGCHVCEKRRLYQSRKELEKVNDKMKEYYKWENHMEQWQNEAKFVLKTRKKVSDFLFSEDDINHTKRKKHEAFLSEWSFTDYEILDLDQAIAMFILPRLAYFRTKTDSIPNNLLKSNPEKDENAAFQEWQKIVNTICDGLHLYIEKYPTQFSDKEKEMWCRAKAYLFEYFEHLWI